MKGTITSAVVTGNAVVQEITWRGTHSGPLPLAGGTIPASGKRQIARASQALIFEGDRVKESRRYFDMLSLLQQIGDTQPTGASGG